MGQSCDAIRVGIFDVLRFIADSEQQTALQHRAPHVDVPAEIFCMWSDDLCHPETAEFAEAFTAPEREVLATFDQAFNDIMSSLPQALAPLDAFIQSEAWQRGREAARRTLDLLGGGMGC